MNNFFEKFAEEKHQEILKQLSTEFEKIDEELYQNKEKIYQVHCFRKRNIMTEFGSVSFKRRYYRYLEDGKIKYKALADEYLGFNKHCKIANSVVLKIVKMIHQGKRYQDILDTVPNCQISKMTISRIFRRYNLNECYDKEIENIEKIDLLNEKYLYMNMDEAYLFFKKKGKIVKHRIRLITFNTGHDWSKPKFPLRNKRGFFIIKEIRGSLRSKEWVDKINHHLNIFYKNYENCKIIGGGDAAPWIQDSIREMFGEYIYDKFHGIKELKTAMFVRNEKTNFSHFLIAKKLFNDGEYNKLMLLLKTLKGTKIPYVIKLFKGIQKGITNQSADWNIGCSAESDISHLVKAPLGYGAKIFNYDTYKNILTAKMATLNKINLFKNMFNC